MRIEDFRGDFEFLPIASALRYRNVPLYPTSEDFQAATVEASSDLASHAEAHWYIEAMRWRRTDGYGRPLEEGIKSINVRVAARLYEALTND